MNFKKIFIIILFVTYLILNCTNCYASETDAFSEELSLYSQAAILIDSDTGLILYSKNKDEKMYPASTTKILTSIIAIEKCDLSDTVTINSSVFSSIPAGYSSANLLDGEELSVKDLLELFLVHSANDAGYVLAEHISGSIDNFAELMNQKAKEIGCTQSHFTNPSGVHNDNHYSTAYDMSLIAKYCMQNKTFRNIVSMTSCTIAPTNKSDTRYFANTNDLLNSTSKYYLDGCTGIKTGYTSEAKNCLISSCKKNNMELICVVLGAETTESGDSARYVDTHTIFNYGFNNYSIRNILNQNDIITSIKVLNGTKDSRNLDLVASDDLNIIMRNNSKINEPIINLNEIISAPISQGSTIGTVTYTINNKQYTVPLHASHNVEQNDFLLFILIASFILVIILILLVFLISKFRKNKKKKLKYDMTY